MMVLPAPPHADDMDDETFVKHYNLRHVRRDLGMPRVVSTSPANMWALRAYHDRVHQQHPKGHNGHTHKEST